jgi:hypothetical protein
MFNFAQIGEKTSGGVVRDLTLASASLALDGIDFATRLDRLHHHGKARAVAGWTSVFADFRRELSHLSHVSLSGPTAHAVNKRPC